MIYAHVLVILDSIFHKTTCWRQWILYSGMENLARKSHAA